jgi:hypothetical protein
LDVSRIRDGTITTGESTSESSSTGSTLDCATHSVAAIQAVAEGWLATVATLVKAISHQPASGQPAGSGASPRHRALETAVGGAAAHGAVEPRTPSLERPAERRDEQGEDFHLPSLGQHLKVDSVVICAFAGGRKNKILELSPHGRIQNSVLAGIADKHGVEQAGWE